MGENIKKIFKKVLCVCLLFAIVSITSEAATKSYSFKGNQQANISPSFKLNKGKRYTFKQIEQVSVRPTTSAREIQFGNHLYWDHWYGAQYIDGKDVTKKIGNSRKEYHTYTYDYDFDHYIDTTTDDFCFNYGAFGANVDYDFVLDVKY